MERNSWSFSRSTRATVSIWKKRCQWSIQAYVHEVCEVLCGWGPQVLKAFFVQPANPWSLCRSPQELLWCSLFGVLNTGGSVANGMLILRRKKDYPINLPVSEAKETANVLLVPN